MTTQVIERGHDHSILQQYSTILRCVPIGLSLLLYLLLLHCICLFYMYVLLYIFFLLLLLHTLGQG